MSETIAQTALQDASFETGSVMTELVAKARETRAQGGSRREFFAKTAKLAGATAMGAAGISLLQTTAARAAGSTPSSDTVQDILDIACTAEALAITFYYQALNHPTQLPDVNNAANQNYFQAALTQELEHLEYLKSLGGAPLTRKFYFPENMFSDESVFFPTALLLEEYFISAYLAAAMDFSGVYSSNITSPSPTLIGAAVQILGVECEHRALLGVAANMNPPNNVIAETALLTSVSGAVAPLTPFLSGGSGFGTGIYNTPDVSKANAIAGQYNTSFFQKPAYV
jgi:hypothetical protein